MVRTTAGRDQHDSARRCLDSACRGVAMEVLESRRLLSLETSALVDGMSADAPGLLGMYYDNARLEGAAAVQRVDADRTYVDPTGGSVTGVVNWPDITAQLDTPDSPLSTGLPAIDSGQGISIRWMGSFTPPVSGQYVFTVRFDDQARFYFNGERFFDAFRSDYVNPQPDYPRSESTRAMNLTAGNSYPILLDYSNTSGPATIELRFRGPEIADQILPASLNGMPILSSQIVPPAAPTSVSAKPGSVSAQLTWYDKARDETENRLELSTDGGVTWSICQTLPPVSNNALTSTYASYFATGLTPATAYQFRVVVCNPAGETISSVVSFATKAMQPLPATQLPTFGDVQLSTEGTLDWVHWGRGGDTSARNFKQNGGSISASVIGDGTAFSVSRYGSTTFSWSNGSPTASVRENRDAIAVAGQGRGFRITVPASNSTDRVLKLYVASYLANASLTASISDNCFLPVTSELIHQPYSGVTTAVYTVHVRSELPQQTLTLDWVQTSDDGFIILPAATLASGSMYSIDTVSATEVSDGVRVAWSTFDRTELPSFSIDRSRDGVQWTQIATGVQDTTYVDTDPCLAVGGWYYYRVRATSISHISVTSAPASILLSHGDPLVTIDVGTNSNDVLYLTRDETYFRVYNLAGIPLDPILRGEVAPPESALAVSHLVAGYWWSFPISVDMLSGDDTFILDLRHGAQMPAIEFDGGSGNDRLHIITTSVQDTLGISPNTVTRNGVIIATYAQTESITSTLPIVNGWLSLYAGVYACGAELNGLKVHIRSGAILTATADLSLAGLMIEDGGELDLKTFDVTVAGGDAATLAGYVQSGVIKSTSITSITTLGVIPQDGGMKVKYTYFGDVNGDGQVNLSDYFIVDSGYLNKRTGFFCGDVNYSGEINLTDYFLIDSSYLRQSTPLSAKVATVAADKKVFSKAVIRKAARRVRKGVGKRGKGLQGDRV